MGKKTWVYVWVCEKTYFLLIHSFTHFFLAALPLPLPHHAHAHTRQLIFLRDHKTTYKKINNSEGGPAR